MKISKRFLLVTLASFALAGSMVGIALADPGKGQKTGQDPLKLALTQCSNAGKGNGGEYVEGVGSKYVGAAIVSSQCIEDKLGHLLTKAEFKTLIDNYNCEFLIGSERGGIFACEIDPGNSSSHNNAQNP